MLFLTRLLGVTGSEAERDRAGEKALFAEIVAKVLQLQANAAAKQRRELARGTHAKGVCVRASFEVFNLADHSDRALATRLARGMFAKPGVYPAVVRFANADQHKNSDHKHDVRAMSFSVDLTRGGTAVTDAPSGRQDFSLQNTTTLPINDASAFLATMKVITASNPAAGLWSLSLSDKLKVVRTLALAQLQMMQPVRPYQQLTYGSNVPFCHGPTDVVKFSAVPSAANPAQPLQRRNPDALKDELARHVAEDSPLSVFDFRVQFLDVDRMTYWGRRHDADFWIENASINWNEAQAPFHSVGRLILLHGSGLDAAASEAEYIDVTGNSMPDSQPVGSINRARSHAEAASRRARAHRPA
jgi:hypothetical protein